MLSDFLMYSTTSENLATAAPYVVILLAVIFVFPIGVALLPATRRETRETEELYGMKTKTEPGEERKGSLSCLLWSIFGVNDHDYGQWTGKVDVHPLSFERTFIRARFCEKCGKAERETTKSDLVFDMWVKAAREAPASAAARASGARAKASGGEKGDEDGDFFEVRPAEGRGKVIRLPKSLLPKDLKKKKDEDDFPSNYF